MPYEVAAKTLMLEQLRRAISHISLHNGIPGRSTEIAGDDYARQRAEFHNPANGRMRLSEKQSFEVPQGATVTHAGFWTSATGGVLLAWAPVREASFGKSAGVYWVDSGMLDLNLE
jgi:hypothetical protein